METILENVSITQTVELTKTLNPDGTITVATKPVTQPDSVTYIAWMDALKRRGIEVTDKWAAIQPENAEARKLWKIRQILLREYEAAKASIVASELQNPAKKTVNEGT